MRVDEFVYEVTRTFEHFHVTAPSRHTLETAYEHNHFIPLQALKAACESAMVLTNPPRLPGLLKEAKKLSAQAQQRVSNAQGGYWADGSWCHDHRPDPLFYQFVDGLVKARRNRPITPEFVRSAILLSPYVDAFPSVDTWTEYPGLKLHDGWTIMPTRTSAEAAIKYAGYGSNESIRWQGGWCGPSGSDLPMPVNDSAGMVAA